MTEEKNKDLEIIDIIAAMLRHKKLIILLPMITAIVFIIISIVSIKIPAEKSFLPNYYSPRAIMLINDSNSGSLTSALSSSGIGDLASLVGLSGSGTSYGALATYIVSIESYLDAIVDKFDLSTRYNVKKYKKAWTREILRENLIVDFNDGTGILTISFKDIDPVFATKVVNYAVELLDKQFSLIGGNRNQTRKIQLEEKLSDVIIEMKNLENDIQSFQTKYGVISVESLATEHISTVAQVRSELIMKEMEISTYRTLAQVEDPQIRRLKTERDNLIQLLKELEEGYSKYESGMPSQKELPKIALEYTHLKRDLMVQEEIYKLLIQQYEATKLALSGEEPVFQIIQVAQVPEYKAGPSRGFICAVATVMAFMLAILIAFILEYVESVSGNPEQAKKIEKAWKGKR